MSGAAENEMRVVPGHVHGPECVAHNGRIWCPDCGSSRGVYRDEWQDRCWPGCDSTAPPVNWGPHDPFWKAPGVHAQPWWRRWFLGSRPPIPSAARIEERRQAWKRPR